MATDENGKEKLDRDYRELEECIENLAKEEVDKIRKKMDALKQEAARVGEAVDVELGESETASVKKES